MSDPRDFLTYDPETGDFFWKVRSGRMVAGSLAGKTTKRGYRMLLVKGRHYQAHRAAWLFHYGDWPDGQIDHINRDPADNRISNLRVVTASQNCLNRNVRVRGEIRHGGSGITQLKNGKWQVQVHDPKLGRPVYGGVFAEEKEASEKARKMRLEMEL